MSTHLDSTTNLKPLSPAPFDHEGPELTFIILRGLPGSGADQMARDIMQTVIDNGVSSVAILNSLDLIPPNEPVRKSNLKLAHRENYRRAVNHFMAGTSVVILNNFNIARSQYWFYVNTAKTFGYNCYEQVIGNTNPTDDEIREMLASYSRRIPFEVIARYRDEFER